MRKETRDSKINRIADNLKMFGISMFDSTGKMRPIKDLLHEIGDTELTIGYLSNELAELDNE